jgi:dCMP deaminase
MYPSTQAMNRWDRRFFELCNLLGSWSEDRSRRVGCLIVSPSNDVRAIGFNGLPRGVNGNIEERHSREDGEKYHWFEHAERNAIYNAARAGTPISGCRMYTNLFPCSDCARGIIQSGIIQLCTYAPPAADPSFSHSFEVAITMLYEARVEVQIFDPLDTSGSQLLEEIN